MAENVRVTVIAAGFERWEESRGSATAPQRGGPSEGRSLVLGDPVREDIFATPEDDGDLDLGDDEFDVPSFLK
jgi:hypothetical protein